MKKSKRNLKLQSGFTLLELIISLTLMAVISITTTQMLKRSTQQTKKITSGIDEANRLRTVMSIMKKDVSKAFNYRSLNRFLQYEAEKIRFERYDQKVDQFIKNYNEKNKPEPPWKKPLSPEQLETMKNAPDGPGDRPPQPQKKKEKIYTDFIGTKDELYFTSASGIRLRKEESVSDLIEVGYTVSTCKSLKLSNTESKCLFRSLSYNLDGDIKEGGKASPILEHIEELEFKYLDFEQTDDPKWLDSWDSSDRSNAQTGEKFPAAVQIHVKLKVPKNKEEAEKKTGKVLELTGVFKVQFPNNKPFEKIKLSQQNKPNRGQNANPTDSPTGL